MSENEFLIILFFFLGNLYQVYEETNVLQDGTLIDLCGATLLWRSAEGLQSSPVRFFFHIRLHIKYQHLYFDFVYIIDEKRFRKACR